MYIQKSQNKALYKENIRSISNEIKAIDEEIASLNSIYKDDSGYEGSNSPEIQAQLSQLEQSKIKMKESLENAKIESINLKREENTLKIKLIECEISKKIDDLEENINGLSKKIKETESSIKDNFVVQHINKCLATIKVLQGEGVTECNEVFENLNKELDSFAKEQKRLSLKQKQLSNERELFKTQIANLQEKNRLKNDLLDCKIRLVKCSSSSEDNAQVIAGIKEEMKTIIKQMIHTSSFLKLKENFYHSRNNLKSLKYLNNEGIKNDYEISKFRNNIKLIKVQLEHENNKVKLLDELKALEAIEGLEDNELEDKLLKERAQLLKNDINTITIRSLNFIKSLANNETLNLEEQEAIAKNISFQPNEQELRETMIEELKKWLAENMIKEGLNADLQEAIISAALLNLTKSNISVKTSEPDTASTQDKIKSLAIGACEKFCMSQVVQSAITINPALSVLYAAGVIGQHYLFGDAQISTLANKTKRFVIAEAIKQAGVAVIGGSLAVGATGTVFAIPAAMYLASTGIAALWQKSEAKAVEGEQKSVSITDLSSAAIELFADTAVEAIYKKII